MYVVVFILISADGEKKVMWASLKFSSLCQTNGIWKNNQKVIMHTLCSFSCLLKKPSVCKFLCNCFQLFLHLQNFLRSIKRQWNSLALYLKVVSNWQKFLLFQVFLFLQGTLSRMGGSHHNLIICSDK